MLPWKREYLIHVALKKSPNGVLKKEQRRRVLTYIYIYLIPTILYGDFKTFVPPPLVIKRCVLKVQMLLIFVSSILLCTKLLFGLCGAGAAHFDEWSMHERTPG